MTSNGLIYLSIGCWASAGYNPEGCVAVEEQLKSCMDSSVRSLKPWYLLLLTVVYRNDESQDRTRSTTISRECIPRLLGRRRRRGNWVDTFIIVYYYLSFDGSNRSTSFSPFGLTVYASMASISPVSTMEVVKLV